jgi:hypothetical protein
MNFTVPCILLPLLSTRAVNCSFNGFVTIVISACQSDNGVDCTPNTDEKYKTETNKDENDSLTQWFTGVQTWAILVDRDIVDMGIRPWVCPDVVKAKSSQPLKKLISRCYRLRCGILRRIHVAQNLGNVGHRSVLPANENVARPGIVLDCFLHTVNIVTLTMSVDFETQVSTQG